MSLQKGKPNSQQILQTVQQRGTQQIQIPPRGTPPNTAEEYIQRGMFPGQQLRSTVHPQSMPANNNPHDMNKQHTAQQSGMPGTSNAAVMYGTQMAPPFYPRQPPPQRAQVPNVNQPPSMNMAMKPATVSQQAQSDDSQPPLAKQMIPIQQINTMQHVYMAGGGGANFRLPYAQQPYQVPSQTQTMSVSTANLPFTTYGTNPPMYFSQMMPRHQVPAMPSTQHNQLPKREKKLVRIQDPTTSRDLTEAIVGYKIDASESKTSDVAAQFSTQIAGVLGHQQQSIKEPVTKLQAQQIQMQQAHIPVSSTRSVMTIEKTIETNEPKTDLSNPNGTSAQVKLMETSSTEIETPALNIRIQNVVNPMNQPAFAEKPDEGAILSDRTPEMTSESVESPKLPPPTVPTTEVIPAARVEPSPLVMKQTSNFVAAADQWSPLNPEGKRQYDRVFLLRMQLQPLCLRKPEGLPDLEIIKDTVRNIPVWTPINRLLSQRVNITEPKRKESIILSSDIKLNKSDIAGNASHKSDTEPGSAKAEDLYEEVRMILDNLTPEVLQLLIQRLNGVSIGEEEKLKGVVDLIFQKSLDEPSFSITYASLCKYIAMKRVSVGAVIDNEFLEDKGFGAVRNKEREFKKVLQESERKSKVGLVENLRFMGVLFKINMLTSSIMHDCLQNLLTVDDKDTLECLCRLLITIDKDMDSDKNKTIKEPFRDDRVNSYFRHVQEIIKKPQTSSRVRFMLQEALDIHSNLEFSTKPCAPWKSTSPSPEQLKTELIALFAKQSENEEIFDWIDAHLTESQCRESSFVRTLMIAVCQSVLEKNDVSFNVDKILFRSRCSIMKKYLHSEAYEMNALYGLQALMHQLRHPKDVLHSIFGFLYAEKIISKEAFLQWEASEDPVEQEGKEIALNSVRSFYVWLKKVENASVEYWYY